MNSPISLIISTENYQKPINSDVILPADDKVYSMVSIVYYGNIGEPDPNDPFYPGNYFEFGNLMALPKVIAEAGPKGYVCLSQVSLLMTFYSKQNKKITPIIMNNGQARFDDTEYNWNKSFQQNFGIYFPEIPDYSIDHYKVPGKKYPFMGSDDARIAVRRDYIYYPTS
ncbi:hypothetical protein [Xenorhabdus thailandensis]|uniref:hypothetical protein n=1 Tax=Xenorhabdus thailandensis TaxID=3136255 RepID=UPI0030F38E6E